MIASTAFHRMAHPEGEVAMAKAAETCNQTAFSLSNWATSTNEEVGQVAPSCLKFFQIYMSKSEAVNMDLWKRVKNAGFTALLLTTDTQLLGKREKDTRNGFELPPHLNLANLTKYESSGETNTLKASGNSSGLAAYVKAHKDNEIGWDIIPYVKKTSGLKVIAKGIMCYEDARLAIDNGADGVYVSNHGARQLDTTPATI